MKNGKYFIGAAVIIVVLLAWTLNATESKSEAPVHEAPAQVATIEGSALSRVTLTQHASDRLDIQVAAVSERNVNGAVRLIAPYAAVLYEADGSAWVYTNPEPLVFVRHAVTIEHIEGADAILVEGPAVGTKVVTVGGAMLLGTEHGVGH